MTRIKLLPLLVLVSLLLALTAPAFVSSTPLVPALSGSEPEAQLSPLYYDFRILNETVHVRPQMDASVFINYSITFRNYGDEFEFIDVGFPNPYYDLDSIEAYWSLEGGSYVELTSIAPSSAIPIGVEIYMPYSLRPDYGEMGTLLVWGNQPRMVYLDTDPSTPGYVGYEFVPTWYSDEYCRGTDYLGVHLHFPNGFNNGTLAKWHHTEYDRYYWTSTNLVYVWEYASINYQGLLHGISFPYDEAYITTYFTAGFEEWWWAYSGLIILAVVALVIFGCCGAIIYASRSRGALSAVRLRKQGYLPPAVKVEALGVRRGLTVVEAAVLNEVPLNRVFTMVVFGLLKKELLRIERPDPKRAPTFHKHDEAIAKAASAQGRLHYYERLFLKAITPHHTLGKPQIKTMLNTLIKTTTRKLEGYSRTDTKVFYTRMIDTAWRHVDQAQTPDAQASALDEYAEWLILTPDYDRRLKTYPTYYSPPWFWWWLWASHPRPHTLGPTPVITTGVAPITPVNITNFANGVVLGTQNFANSVVSGFTNLANAIATGFRPPPPRPRARSSYSGRSCACACACVSCACACAGGGR
ncbi:MAG: hypothetical protein ACFE89_06115 [Candidatus Hodarchaeota archaeon]